MAKKRKKRRGKGRYGRRMSAAARKKLSLAQKRLYRLGRHPFARRRRGRKGVRRANGRRAPKTRAKAKTRYIGSALERYNLARRAARGVTAPTPYLSRKRRELEAVKKRRAEEAERRAEEAGYAEFWEGALSARERQNLGEALAQAGSAAEATAVREAYLSSIGRA